MTDDFDARMAAIDHHEEITAEAIDAIMAVLLDPEPDLLGGEEARLALTKALWWLELDATCGDCVTGRCHFGGEQSRFNEATVRTGGRGLPCGCARHEASVAARGRKALLIEAGINPVLDGGA